MPGAGAWRAHPAFPPRHRHIAWLDWWHDGLALRQARRKILDQLRGSGNEQMLKKSVSDMNLSVRARKALQLLNIQTLGDLVSHTEAELMGVKNFGATSLTEVKEKLVEYGLSLRKLDE